ncbi:hypothetical protein ACLOJK_007790 [Asimina triloba]
MPTPTCQRTADVKKHGASGGGQATRAARAVHAGSAGKAGEVGDGGDGRRQRYRVEASRSSAMVETVDGRQTRARAEVSAKTQAMESAASVGGGPSSVGFIAGGGSELGQSTTTRWMASIDRFRPCRRQKMKATGFGRADGRMGV